MLTDRRKTSVSERYFQGPRLMSGAFVSRNALLEQVERAGDSDRGGPLPAAASEWVFVASHGSAQFARVRPSDASWRRYARSFPWGVADADTHTHTPLPVAC